MGAYCKPVLTIEQQIVQLRSRGLQINNEERASQDLAQKNYYRLRAYWLPFETTNGLGEHSFLPGTTWEKVMDFYEFDRELRLLILSAIERMEISMRTRWAHVLALKYGPHAHEETKIFYDPEWHSQNWDKLKDEYKKSHEVFADHFKKKYPKLATPPIWSSCELMSLGELSRWYKELRHRSDQREIAKGYNLDEEVLKSFLHHLSVVRNICAHHSRLWNRKITVKMKQPKDSRYAKYFVGGCYNKIYPTVVMLWLLLKIIEPSCDWLRQIKKLFQWHPSVDCVSMGFPKNWESLLV